MKVYDLILASFGLDSWISLCLVLEVPEGGDEDKQHLWVEVWDVFPNEEDDSSQLAGDRNCILCVQFLFLWGLTSSN